MILEVKRLQIALQDGINQWQFPQPKHLGGSPYWETPWEIESYGLEKAMIWSFINVQALAKEMQEGGWGFLFEDNATSEIVIELE